MRALVKDHVGVDGFLHILAERFPNRVKLGLRSIWGSWKLNELFLSIFRDFEHDMMGFKECLKILIAIESQLRFIVFEDDCRYRKRPESRQRHDLE